MIVRTWYVPTRLWIFDEASRSRATRELPRTPLRFHMVCEILVDSCG